MKTIAIFSGGMDSATLVAHLMALGDEVRCLSVDYGQRHRRELESAKNLCDHWGLEHRVADLRAITPLISNSSQTSDKPVPYGHYAEENMKQTVVPNRNMIMLSVAIGWAINEKFDRVAYGAHSGDHAIYPDCRPEFVKQLDQAARIADWNEISIYAPFLGMDKGDIAKEGLSLGVPFQMTWTCYEGLERPCGKCGACQERAEAFQKAGAEDPLCAAHAS